jgi:uncharacterized protein YprB with RNaseH-like and TPR domain
MKIEKGLDVSPEPTNKTSIDKVIRGEWIESHGERVFVSRNSYPFGSSHGNVIFEKVIESGSHSEFWGIEEIKKFQLQDYLFLDTETSGLSLGAGSIIFLFGGCFFTENGLEVIQFFLDDPSSELFFLANIEELIHTHKCLVSYNGKSFDIPMLRSRMILNRMAIGNLDRPHLDLLHFARNLWKLRLESRRLSDIEKDILAFQRTEDEVPGWLVPQLYQEYLASGDASPLEGVIYHNENDIVSLAALFSHINKMISTEGSLDEVNYLDIISIGSIYQKTGNLSLSEEFYKFGLEKSIAYKLDNKILRNYALLMKKQKKWTKAVEYWEMAARKKDMYACIELAKYFEHRKIDNSVAVIWVDSAISIAFDTGVSEITIEELKHRKSRLESKIKLKYEK